MEKFGVGTVCWALAGRDKGKYFVVSEVLEGEYVHLADGRGRKLAKPKRKKRMHLRPCGAVSEELRQALQQGDALDARVREALAILKEN